MAFQSLRHIAAAVLAVMLLAQISVAQHASVHFIDHGHIQTQLQDDGDHDHHKNASEACQICLSVKAFSHGLISDPGSMLFVAGFHQPAPSYQSQLYAKANHLLRRPRSPPALLV